MVQMIEEFLPAEKAEIPVDSPTVQAMVQIFRAMADPTRVRILAVLAQEEQCVGALASRLGMSVSAISHQLRYLLQMRLVRRRREGKRVLYALDDDHVRDLFRDALEHVLERKDEPGGESADFSAASGGDGLC